MKTYGPGQSLLLRNLSLWPSDQCDILMVEVGKLSLKSEKRLIQGPLSHNKLVVDTNHPGLLILASILHHYLALLALIQGFYIISKSVPACVCVCFKDFIYLLERESTRKRA